MTIKHPDYPDIDFKPALALLDWDQTYDLAAFRYKFDTNYLDLPLITSNLYLCDRYTPDNIPWAENWGLLVFELNKRLNYYKFLFGSTFTKISSIPNIDNLILSLDNNSTITKKFFLSYLKKNYTEYVYSDSINLVETYEKSYKCFLLNPNETINYAINSLYDNISLPEYSYSVNADDYNNLCNSFINQGVEYDILVVKDGDITKYNNINYIFNDFTNDSSNHIIIYNYDGSQIRKYIYAKTIINDNRIIIYNQILQSSEYLLQSPGMYPILSMTGLKSISWGSSQLKIEIRHNNQSKFIDTGFERFTYIGNGLKDYSQKITFELNDTFISFRILKSTIRNNNINLLKPSNQIIIDASLPIEEKTFNYSGIFWIYLYEDSVLLSIVPFIIDIRVLDNKSVVFNSCVLSEFDEINNSYIDKSNLIPSILRYSEINNTISSINSYIDNIIINDSITVEAIGNGGISLYGDQPNLTMSSTIFPLRNHCTYISANNNKWGLQSNFNSLYESNFKNLYSGSSLITSILGYWDNKLNLDNTNNFGFFRSLGTFTRNVDYNLGLNIKYYIDGRIVIGTRREIYMDGRFPELSKAQIFKHGFMNVYHYDIENCETKNLFADMSGSNIYASGFYQIIKYDLNYIPYIEYEEIIPQGTSGNLSFNLDIKFPIKDDYQYYIDYLSQLTKIQLNEYIKKIAIMDSVRIKEIHACLGAGEYAFYNNNGTQTEYYMHIARNLDYLMKSFGLYYQPDGTLMDIRSNVTPPAP